MEIMRALAPLVARERELIKERYFPAFDDLSRRLEGNSILPGFVPFGGINLDLLALWHRLHIARPLDAPRPRWDDLAREDPR